MKAVGWFAISACAALTLVGCERNKRDEDRAAAENRPTVDTNRANQPRVNEPGTRVEEPSTRPVNIVNTGSGATGSATNSIALARCARESRCNNIGGNKKYSSQEDCMARIRADWRDDLNARECPGGVNQKELDECLTEIRNEDCGNPFDTLGRLAACRSSDICQSTVKAR